MRLPLLLLTALLVSSGALAEDIPVPPIPPVVGYKSEAAPVPDVDAQAPFTATPATPSINVKLYRAPTYDPSVGFAPGSRFQTTEDRKAIQTPGFTVTVPLK